MDPITQQVVLATAGAAAAADATYVDDVFSTTVYTGNSSGTGSGDEQVITTGIDNTEKSLIWFKNRSGNSDHALFDTERTSPDYRWVRTSSTGAELQSAAVLKDRTTTGFTVVNAESGSGVATTNPSNSEKMVAWNFRAMPGFFDVVTYTGNGTAGRTVSHDLGSVPGMIIIKDLGRNTNWRVYHRSIGAEFHLLLGDSNGSSAKGDDQQIFNDTEPTSTVFTLGNDSDVNGASQNYVAYLFAHDDQSFGTDSDEAIIKCGSYTGNGQASGTAVNLGFEPQWVMIKASSSGGNWVMQNTMTGMSQNSSGNGVTVGNGLYANTDGAESGFSPNILPTSTGFEARNFSSYTNANGVEYVYMAIRRPHKPPEAGTDVFGISSHFSGNNSATRAITTGGVTADLILTRSTSNSYGDAVTCWTDRLRGGLSLGISSEQSDMDSYWSNLSGWHALDVMDGYKIGGTKYTYSNQTGNQYISFGIKRAPGFFDIVHYTGTGSATTIAHNLGATPSVVLVKGTDTTFQWYWQHYALGANTWVQLNKAEAKANNGSLFNSTLPTSSVFSVGSAGGNNGSGNKYIAYLFGDLDGISKAGTYSGTGSNIDVDCGFAAGARFVLIKRADSTGDWYLYDSVRGIVSGNDPYSLINTTDDQVTNTDYIDPLNAGFTVTSSAPAALNTSGGTYLFLAIA